MSVKSDLLALLNPLTTPANAVWQTNVPGEVDPPDEYILFQKIAAEPTVHLEGNTGSWRNRFQFTVIALNPERCDVLRAAVRVALNAWTLYRVVDLGDNPDTQDDETTKFAASADFAIWHDD